MKPAKYSLETALGTDRAAIAELLRAADLPPVHSAADLGYFIVARDDRGDAVGIVGAEVCGPDALLRSFVVAASHRGVGMGTRLLERLDEEAATWGVERWWLLTTTAAEFFTRRGFEVVLRSCAPALIRATGQFSGECCSSAVCLTRARRFGR